MRMISLVVAAVCIAGCAKEPAAPPATETAAPPPPVTESPAPNPAPAVPDAVGATAELKATQGHGVSGTLKLSSEATGVHLSGTVSGLTPNSSFGFHVHEKGDCSAPDASSAGGHFNPTGEPHGDPGGATHHLGDMPNLASNAEGSAELDATIPDLTLRTEQANDVVGKAIVIHEKPDDYASQPSGNSGARIACGIIK